MSARSFSRSARCLPAEPDTDRGSDGSGNSGGSSPTNVLDATVLEVTSDSMGRDSSSRLQTSEIFHTPVLMYVASSPRAELVNLDNLSVPLLRMAFLRASARACGVDIVLIKVVVGGEWWDPVESLGKACGVIVMSCPLSEYAEFLVSD